MAYLQLFLPNVHMKVMLLRKDDDEIIIFNGGITMEVFTEDGVSWYAMLLNYELKTVRVVGGYDLLTDCHVGAGMRQTVNWVDY